MILTSEDLLKTAQTNIIQEDTFRCSHILQANVALGSYYILYANTDSRYLSPPPPSYLTVNAHNNSFGTLPFILSTHLKRGLHFDFASTERCVTRHDTPRRFVRRRRGEDVLPSPAEATGTRCDPLTASVHECCHAHEGLIASAAV